MTPAQSRVLDVLKAGGYLLLEGFNPWGNCVLYSSRHERLGRVMRGTVNALRAAGYVNSEGGLADDTEEAEAADARDGD